MFAIECIWWYGIYLVGHVPPRTSNDETLQYIEIEIKAQAYRNKTNI